MNKWSARHIRFGIEMARDLHKSFPEILTWVQWQNWAKLAGWDSKLAKRAFLQTARRIYRANKR